MVTRFLILLCFLVSCVAPSYSSEESFISLTSGWTRTTVTAGSATGTFRGADGTAIDSEGCVVTPWEEGGMVTRACETPTGWATEIVATGFIGPEDARAADIDGDGILDVVSASDSGQRIYVTFRGTPNATIMLPASQGHGRAMQVALADFDYNGTTDIAFGTRGGTATNPAVIGLLTFTGSPRVAANWAYTKLGTAGWTMSLHAVDMNGDGRLDLVVSDRSFYGAHLWDLFGARWLENTGGAWINHPIGPPAGSCPANNYQCTNKTPGDEIFLRVVSPTEVWDCQSNIPAQITSRIRRMTTTDAWATYAVTVLPPAANVAHCQDVLVTDIDGDGLQDVVVSGVIDDHLPTVNILPGTVSVVYWMRAPNWDRGEISAGHGCKTDDIQRLPGPDVRLITSEQVGDDCVAGTGAGGLGVVVYSP